MRNNSCSGTASLYSTWPLPSLPPRTPRNEIRCQFKPMSVLDPRASVNSRHWQALLAPVAAFTALLEALSSLPAAPRQGAGPFGQSQDTELDQQQRSGAGELSLKAASQRTTGSKWQMSFWRNVLCTTLIFQLAIKISPAATFALHVSMVLPFSVQLEKLIKL